MPPVSSAAAAVVADHAVLPAGDLAGGVGRGLQALERLRPEPALRDVLLARPDQLDRALDLARDQRRLDGLVAAVAPAEAAAHVALVVESTCSSLKPSALATAVRDTSGAWLPSQISTWSPASLTRATAFSGSICA